MESKQITIAYAQIINLINAANWHRENCHSSCNVSLHLIKMTAESLLKDCWTSELAEAEKLINDTNWL